MAMNIILGPGSKSMMICKCRCVVVSGTHASEPRSMLIVRRGGTYPPTHTTSHTACPTGVGRALRVSRAVGRLGGPAWMGKQLQLHSRNTPPTRPCPTAAGQPLQGEELGLWPTAAGRSLQGGTDEGQQHGTIQLRCKYQVLRDSNSSRPATAGGKDEGRAARHPPAALRPPGY